MMKVDKTDPDEQKKRKSQTEREQDFIAEQTAKFGPTSGKAQVAGPSIYDSGEKDFSVPDVDKDIETKTPAKTKTTGTLFGAPEAKESEKEASTRQKEEVAPSKRAERKERPEVQAKKAKGAEKKETKGVEGEKKPEAKARAKEEVQGKEVKKAVEPEKKKVEVNAKQKKETDELQQTEEPLPKGAWEAVKKEASEEKISEKKKKEGPASTDVEVAPTTAAPTETAGPTPTAAPQPLSAPFANLPPQVQAIFERMVGVITVMQNSGITETTISLNNPQFENSVFYGSEIVLTEYSTAPLQYNVQLLGNTQATTLFAENAPQLMAAFETGNYNFRINRVDTGVLEAAKARKKRQQRRIERKKGAGG